MPEPKRCTGVDLLVTGDAADRMRANVEHTPGITDRGQVANCNFPACRRRNVTRSWLVHLSALGHFQCLCYHHRMLLKTEKVASELARWFTPVG
jgi:hypothetical protein